MQSKNAISAGNQQERLEVAQWIVGFTDGEGCFSISVIKNHTTRFGIQIFPEFVLTQGAKSVYVLEMIHNFFGCGRVFVNKRNDNHNEHLYRYCVRSLKDLNEVIIPFFERNKLKTEKINDFNVFCKVIKMMLKKEHLTEIGKNKIITLAETTNRKKKRRRESSETTRQNI